MKKIILFLLLAFTIYGQSSVIVTRPPQLTVESKTLGTMEESETDGSDSLLVTVTTRRVRLDSIWTPNSIMAVIYDTTLAFGDSFYVFINYNKDTTGTISDQVFYAHSGYGSPDTSTIGYTVYEDSPSGAPDTPTLLAVTDSTHSETGMIIDWADNIEPDISYYTLQKSTDNVTFTTLATIDAGASLYTDTDIIEGLRYYYKVKATDASGYSSSYTSSVNAKSLTSLAALYFDADASGGSGTYSDPFEPDSLPTSLVSYDAVYFEASDTFTTVPNLVTGLKVARYGGTGRAQFHHSSYSNTNYLFPIRNVDSVMLDGLHGISAKWVEVYGADNNTVQNCLFEHYDSLDADYCGDKPIYIWRADKNTFYNNIFKGTPTAIKQDLMFIYIDSRYNLIHYNQFLNSTHALISVKSDPTPLTVLDYSDDDHPHHNIFSHNYFRSVYHSALVHASGPYSSLVEYNYVERAGTGTWSSQASGYPANESGNNCSGIALYAMGDGHIVRNNIFRKGGSPSTEVGSFYAALAISKINADAVPDRAENLRFYNNTFYDNYGEFRIGTGETSGYSAYNNTTYLGADNNKVWNNLFYKNGSTDSLDFYVQTYSIPVSIEADHNAFMTGVLANNINVSYSKTQINYRYDDIPITYGNGSIVSSGTNNNIGNEGTAPFSPSVTTYIDTADWDVISDMYAIASGSVCQDAGGFLTQVNGAVSSSTSVTVDDARWFVDPTDYGNMISGDTLYFTSGTAIKTGVVESISSNTITLSEAITLDDNSYVSLKYSGSAPDIGAVEYEECLTSEPTIVDYYATSTDSSATVYLKISLTDEVNDLWVNYSVGDRTLSLSADLIPSSYSTGDCSIKTPYYKISGLNDNEWVYYRLYMETNYGVEVTDLDSIQAKSVASEDTDWGANLLASYNYGFEDGDVSDWSSMSADSFAVSTTQADSGTYSGYVEEGDWFQGVRTHSVTVTSSDTVKITYSIYIVSGTVLVYDVYNKFGEFDTEYTTTGSWIEGEHTEVATGTTEAIGFLGKQSGTKFYIDNVRVQIKE